MRLRQRRLFAKRSLVCAAVVRRGAPARSLASALADRGARLLIERYGIDLANVEWSPKNREAGRPFIEHQLEIIDFYVGLQRAARDRADLRVVHPDELIASFPDRSSSPRNPFALHVRASHRGTVHEIGLVPDLAFGLILPGGARHSFMVEIDRGTMPVVRSDIGQTSFQRKMRAYLTTQAAKLHERHFGWKTFRVLTVTTDHSRMQSMQEALRRLHVAGSSGASLFYFATRDELGANTPLTHAWRDGNGREVRLI
ncbi:MAG: replication-relaxation family protein [Beijerinckiaceae bacterium]